MISEDVHKWHLTLEKCHFGDTSATVINLLLLLGPLHCYHFSHADGDMVWFIQGYIKQLRVLKCTFICHGGSVKIISKVNTLLDVKYAHHLFVEQKNISYVSSG